MNEKLSGILHKPWVVPASVGIASFVGGIGLGFIICKRRYTTVYKFEVEEKTTTQLELDFDANTETLRELRDRSMVSHPSNRGAKIAEVVNIVEADEEDDEEDDEYVVEESELVHEQQDPSKLGRPLVLTVEYEDGIRNKFIVNKYAGWDWDIEKTNRSEDRPYVLFLDEFMDNEKNYHQNTLTYYSVDNVLADDHDQPVPNHEQLVGELKFGHGSLDEHVVYVRNDKMHAEWEILLHETSYQEEVLNAVYEPGTSQYFQHQAKMRKWMD